MKKKVQSKAFRPSDSFLEELLNHGPDFSRGESRITFEIGKGLLIEGFRSVCEYTDGRLIIATYSRSIIIEGTCLCICCMMKDSVAICGKIDTVRLA